MEAIEEEPDEQRRLWREPVPGTEAGPGKHLEDRGDAVDPRIHACGGDPTAKPAPEPLTETLQLRVPLRREVAERREARRRGDGIAVERAAVDQGAGAPGIELEHH